VQKHQRQAVHRVDTFPIFCAFVLNPHLKTVKFQCLHILENIQFFLIISSLQQLHVPEPSQFVSDKCDKKGRVETLWMVSLAYDLLVSCKQLELFFFENSDKYTTHVTILFRFQQGK